MKPQRRKPLPAFRKPTESRSRNMRAVRSVGNLTTENLLEQLLRHSKTHGWRKHPKAIEGSPDFAFPESQVLLFVDGCFWHSCPRCGHVPKTNRAYWRAKIERNKRRDARVSRKLRAEGFSVIRTWECDLKSRPLVCLNKLRRALRKRRNRRTRV